MASALLLSAVGGCGNGRHDSPELTLKEAVSAGYYLPAAAEGLGFSLGVVNHADRALEITAVHVDADPGLTVTFVGWATCLKGCFGTSGWADLQKDMGKGVMVPDGTLPVPVPAKGADESRGFAAVSLEFRAVLDPALLNDPKPCYLVRRITVDLKSGRKKVPVEYPDGTSPLALQARDTQLDPDCPPKPRS